MTQPERIQEPAPRRGWLLRLPEAIRNGLSAEQEDAIAIAVGAEGRKRHPVDLRVSVPLPGRSVFFTMIGGRERRSRERRIAERTQHPIHTLGNILFVLFGLAGFYAVGLAAFLLSTSLLEF